ncbi:GyrI-like domain-containing protein [Cellulomonas sp. ICMP 17802]|uniref:GyrI-like domain-containing protein n=1 Tax=Cellulomonas sp. ICMP 17802 TaxID=3239199 RepID=UPI00351AE662
MRATTLVPVLVDRPAVPYVGISRTVTPATFALVADRFAELFAWLAEHSLTPAGPPFFRYDVIDRDRSMVVEAGMPLAEEVQGADGEVVPGVLPAGRYVVTSHVGPPDELVQVTADLLAWAEAEGLRFDRWDTPLGDAWGCRLELQLSDPRVEPDMTRWETQLVFRLADDDGAAG